MVSIRQIGDKHGFVRKHIAVGLSDCPQLPFRGLNIPLYKLGNSISHRNEAMGCTFGEESLLDVLLLAQWEDRAWKGLVRYDVTSCETKACYLANPLPVEIIPGVSLLGSSQGGIEVCELTDYPIKSLLFKSQQNVRRMVELVAEISSCLQAQNMLFNLLISDGGNKVFLFPQVSTSISGNKLTAWECAGHFVFRQESNFIEATEKDIAKRLTISSLDDAAFQALKQLCCAVACNLIRT